jgi:hypothetical protein
LPRLSAACGSDLEVRAQLAALHEQFSQLPPPGQLALIADTRDQRRSLQRDIACVERMAEEIWGVLAAERPSSLVGEASPDRIVTAWVDGSAPAHEELTRPA